MASLLLIRHGQASYGQTDYDRLSAAGEQQARALGAHLARGKLDALFVGPLRRQQQTATLAGEVAGAALPAPTTVEELAEYPAFEILKQLSPRLVREQPKFAQLASAPTPKLLDEAFHLIVGKWSSGEWTAEGVERIDQFVARVRAGLERVMRSAASGARIAAITSAGPIGVALGLAFGATHHRMLRASIVIRNASISELVFRTRDFAWRGDRAGSGGAASGGPESEVPFDQVSVVSSNLTAHLPDDLQTER